MTESYLRKFLRSKIHRARITGRNVDYEGSISIPSALLHAADIEPYEAVHVWNVTRGTRFETYAIEDPEDAHAICVNGAAAHLVEPGDIVIVACFGFSTATRTERPEPKVIFVDERNLIVERRLEEPRRLPGER